MFFRANSSSGCSAASFDNVAKQDVADVAVDELAARLGERLEEIDSLKAFALPSW